MQTNDACAEQIARLEGKLSKHKHIDEQSYFQQARFEAVRARESLKILENAVCVNERERERESASERGPAGRSCVRGARRVTHFMVRAVLEIVSHSLLLETVRDYLKTHSSYQILEDSRRDARVGEVLGVRIMCT